MTWYWDNARLYRYPGGYLSLVVQFYVDSLHTFADICSLSLFLFYYFDAELSTVALVDIFTVHHNQQASVDIDANSRK